MPFSMYDADACREAIRTHNHELRAVLHVVAEPSRSPSGKPSRSPSTNGESRPLSGVPFVLKDTWDTAGIPTTGGSFRYRDRVPSSSAPVYEALVRQGAVLLGKSNLGDMAFSAESDNHLLGPVQNPHDRTRTAGGSTGGGAAAVAAGLAAFDWGTDFGGSVRIPAAFCGVVGLRLSQAAWPVEHHHFPRMGPFFWPWLGMGPLARRVAGIRCLVGALAELRRADLPPAGPFGDEVALLAPDRAHLGAWPDFVEETTRALRARGVLARVEHGLPSPSAVRAVFDGYLCAHFTRLAGPGELTVSEGLRGVLAGLASWGRLDKRVHPNTAAALAVCGVGALLLRGQRGRFDARLAMLRDATARVWSGGRLVVTPTTTLPAPRHGRSLLAPSLLSFAKLGNVVDATAIALPFGRFPDGLPRSLQILGPPGSEDAVLALAERIEMSEPQEHSILPGG